MKIKNKILIVVLAFILGACTKAEDEIIGSWDYQTLTANTVGNITWRFRSDGKLIRLYIETDQISGGQYITADTATYSVSQSLTKKKVIITGGKDMPGSPSPEGTLRIDKLKNDILIMTRTQLPQGKKGDAYLRCEMTRNI